MPSARTRNIAMVNELRFVCIVYLLSGLSVPMCTNAGDRRTGDQQSQPWSMMGHH